MKNIRIAQFQHRVVKNLLRRLSIVYTRFLKLRGDPHEIACGFALGIFIGMMPVLGIQMALAVFLAVFFKWSKLAAATGVWISNPVTAPFVYASTYIVGEKVFEWVTGEALPLKFTLHEMFQMLRSAPIVFVVLTIGGVLLGLPLAVAGYYMSYALIQKYRDRIKQELAKDIKKIRTLRIHRTHKKT